ncbi:MAG: nitroreductase family protein [Candidatus Thermoplasmatota archaeon]|nr:nitroreductase family protein [Candidatus Thermoplasmatota archaeon]
MEAIEAILTRRSIRSYTDKPIDGHLLQTILEAGFSAPSAGNQQPWHFVLLDDKTLFENILTFHPHAHMLSEAQKAILVCGDLNLEKFKGYWMLDCSAATQNMLLAAHASSIGSCWLGIYPREDRIIKMRELLNMPSHVVPFSLISLGYPAEQKGMENRYSQARIHYNAW